MKKKINCKEALEKIKKSGATGKVFLSKNDVSWRISHNNNRYVDRIPELSNNGYRLLGIGVRHYNDFLVIDLAKKYYYTAHYLKKNETLFDFNSVDSNNLFPLILTI